MASTASLFAGFSRWGYAFAEASPEQHPARHRPVHPVYHPQFFTSTEFHAVEILVDLILPETRTAHKVQPGAKAAGVAEFIDFMASANPSLQLQFRSGLAWLDQANLPAPTFVALTAPGQQQLLERLAYKAQYRDSDKPGQQFFQLVRKYTVTGFYTTRIGLESLDYPGLTFYGTSPGCTHAGNPEHAGL